MNWTHTLQELENGPIDAFATEAADIEAKRAIAEQLEIIADSLPIPFSPVTELEQRRDESFRKALQLVRDALDSSAALPGEVGSALWAAEALLSKELGQPVWEGRRE